MLNGKIFLYSIVLLNIRVHATNSEGFMQKFTEMILGCAKDYPMTAEDIEQLKNKQMPDNDNMKCLFACVYKVSGMMNDQGKLCVEGVNNHAQIYYSNDIEKLAKAKEFTDACKSVNDVAVSDGNRGCERAALIFQCSVDKAYQFGFGI